MLTYYERPNCTLCEEGKLLVTLAAEELGLAVTYINIETDDALHEQYMLRIPVLMDGQQMIQEGTINYVRLLDYFTS